MKKKAGFASFLLLLIMTLVLAACGKGYSGSQSSGYSSTASSSTGSSMSMPKSESMASSTGNFSGKNGKMVSGMVKISDGKLMLSSFKTDEGPDLYVYLTRDGNVATGKSIAKIDLKNPEQTFSLNGVNPKDYNTVVIYCNKAHVKFGEAKLM